MEKQRIGLAEEELCSVQLFSGGPGRCEGGGLWSFFLFGIILSVRLYSDMDEFGFFATVRDVRFDLVPQQTILGAPKCVNVKFKQQIIIMIRTRETKHEKE